MEGNEPGTGLESYDLMIEFGEMPDNVPIPKEHLFVLSFTDTGHPIIDTGQLVVEYLYPKDFNEVCSYMFALN